MLPPRERRIPEKGSKNTGKSPPPTGNNNKEEYDDGDILSSKTSEPQDVTLEDSIKNKE